MPKGKPAHRGYTNSKGTEPGCGAVNQDYGINTNAPIKPAVSGIGRHIIILLGYVAVGSRVDKVLRGFIYDNIIIAHHQDRKRRIKMGLPLKVGTVFTYPGTTYKITEINQGANMVMTVEVGGRGKGHYKIGRAHV